jgi:phage recombination protein Bet
MSQLTTINQTPSMFTEEQVDLIKRTICNGATDDELQLFINQATRTGLDPFSRQIYFTKDKNGKVNIGTTVDGFRVIANRHPCYAGQLGPFWCGQEGKWTDVWLDNEPPKAAKVGILRSDFKEPLWAVALWSDYAPYYNNKLSYMWEKMSAHMLAKVAECLGLRKACPQELSGLYSAEEMKQEEAGVAVVPKETTMANISVKTTKSGYVDVNTIPSTTLVTKTEFDAFKVYAENLGYDKTQLWEVICQTYPDITNQDFFETFTHSMMTMIKEKLNN